MKKSIFLVFVFVFFINLINAVPINTHVQVQVIENNQIIPDTNYLFTFNITTASDCSGVIYSNSSSLTTDFRGIVSYYLGNTNLLNFNQDLWLCMYRDNILKNISQISAIPYSYQSLNSTYWQGHTGNDGSWLTGINTYNSSYYLNSNPFNFINATNICYSNGTNAYTYNSSYYLNSNPSNYYNSTTALIYKNDTWYSNYTNYYNITQIDTNIKNNISNLNNSINTSSNIQMLVNNSLNYTKFSGSSYNLINTSFVQLGNYNCSSNQVIQNITINSSGAFALCMTPTSTINPNSTTLSWKNITDWSSGTFYNSSYLTNSYNTTYNSYINNNISNNSFYFNNLGFSSFCFSNGTGCTSGDNSSWNQTYASSLYYAITNPFGFYNSTTLPASSTFNSTYNSYITNNISNNSFYLNGLNQSNFCYANGTNSTGQNCSTATSSSSMSYTNLAMLNQSNNYSNNLLQNFSNDDITTNGTGRFDNGIGIGKNPTVPVDAVLSNTSQYGINFNGDTNPLNSAVAYTGINNVRTINIPANAVSGNNNYASKNQLTYNHTIQGGSGFPVQSFNYAGSNILFNTANFGSTNMAFLQDYNYGLYNQVRRTGTINSATWQPIIVGAYNYVQTGTPTSLIYANASGVITSTEIGLDNYIDSNLLVNGGNTTRYVYGVRSQITGSNALTNATQVNTVNAYANYVKFVQAFTGNNWLFYADGTIGNNFLGGDNRKTYFGNSYAASIVYNGTAFIINPQEIGSAKTYNLGDFINTGNITTSYYYGNGSQLTGVCLTNGTGCTSSTFNTTYNSYINNNISNNSFYFNNLGFSSFCFSNGTGCQSSNMNYTNLALLNVTNQNLTLYNLNITNNLTTKTLSISNKTNSGMDRCTLSFGSCNISNTQVRDDTNIFCFTQSTTNPYLFGTYLYISNRTAGSNYIVTDYGSGLDSSVVACILMQPNQN